MADHTSLIGKLSPVFALSTVIWLLLQLKCLSISKHINEKIKKCAQIFLIFLSVFVVILDLVFFFMGAKVWEKYISEGVLYIFFYPLFTLQLSISISLLLILLVIGISWIVHIILLKVKKDECKSLLDMCAKAI